jgi:hypothetical protein
MSEAYRRQFEKTKIAGRPVQGKWQGHACGQMGCESSDPIQRTKAITYSKMFNSNAKNREMVGGGFYRSFGLSGLRDSANIG